MQLAFMIADRDVFTVRKLVCAEPVAGLLVVVVAGAIIEHPACMLAASRLVNKRADGLVLVIPKPAHATVLSVFSPKFGVDVSALIEGRNQVIAMACRT